MSLVNHGQPSVADEIEKYLLTGSSDPVYAAWPGNIMERATRGHDELRAALISAVRLKELKTTHAMPDQVDAVALTRAKVEPMVVGLFPRADRDVVLAMLEKSVVFLTPEKVETILLEESFNHSAWTLANLYLAGSGAELLSDDAPKLVGLSQNTTCYVSPQYFHEDDRFADFVIHEAAHVFHNCKRGQLGLRETRSKVWLLDIEYRKRETFAYSCEAYARILELSTRPAERQALAGEFSRTVCISDERADGDEVAHIVSTAVAARNGWKVILAQCAPPHQRPGVVQEKRSQ
jgi:hypothetical protein